jgi:hypothetical protein
VVAGVGSAFPCLVSPKLRQHALVLQQQRSEGRLQLSTLMFVLQLQTTLQAYYEDPEGFIARRFYAGNMSSAMIGSHNLARTYLLHSKSLLILPVMLPAIR